MNPTQPISFSAGALPVYGSEAYKQAQSGIAPTGFSNTVSSTSLQSQTPLTVTTPSPSISNAIIEGATSLNTSAKTAVNEQTAQQNELVQIKAKKDASLGDLGSIYSELGLTGQKTIQAEHDAGIPDLKKQSDEITNQIEARSLAYRRQIEDLDKTFQGTVSGKAQEVNRIQKDAARELADLSIIQNARNRNLATAQSIVDRKVQLMTEDLKNRAEYLKFVYSENKDLFDKKEQRLFEAETKKADRAYEEARARASLLEKTRLEAISTMAENDASNADLLAVQKMTNPAQIMALAGKSKVQKAAVPTIKTINGVDMQWTPTTGKWETPSTTSTANNESTQKTVEQLSFLKSTAQKASDLSSASGASGFSKFVGDTLVGDTKFRQLEALTNTLKVNVLSLMTDPTIKKFFGPQMSNADVALMTSAGTTLNPDANTPEQMKSEIKRLQDLFNRMESAVNQKTGSVMISPDGKSQVSVSDLTPAQIEEAKKAGWK